MTGTIVHLSDTETPPKTLCGKCKDIWPMTLWRARADSYSEKDYYVLKEDCPEIWGLLDASVSSYDMCIVCLMIYPFSEED